VEHQPASGERVSHREPPDERDVLVVHGAGARAAIDRAGVSVLRRDGQPWLPKASYSQVTSVPLSRSVNEPDCEPTRGQRPSSRGAPGSATTVAGDAPAGAIAAANSSALSSPRYDPGGAGPRAFARMYPRAEPLYSIT
jgi:hypothetical protein